MKTRFIILSTMIAATLTGCYITQPYGMNAAGDDIYYVPGEKELVSSYAKTHYDKAVQNSDEYIQVVEKTRPENKERQLFTLDSVVENNGGQCVTYYSDENGYWLSEFNGTDNDLKECYRLIALYPEGFCAAGDNGFSIGTQLSFDSDWNVYSDGSRFWWFPTNSNISLYSKFLFGEYDKYVYYPSYNRTLDFRVSLGSPWYYNSFSYRPYYSPYYSSYYNTYYDPWFYDPWYYGSWYYDSWYYRPWHYNSWYYNSWYYSGWYGGYHNHIHNNHWGHGPVYGGNSGRNPYNQRPGVGSGYSSNVRRPNTGYGTTSGRSNNVLGGTSSTTIRRPTSTSTTGRTTLGGTTISRPTSRVSSNGTITRPSTTTNSGSTSISRPTSTAVVSRPTSSRVNTVARPTSTTSTVSRTTTSTSSVTRPTRTAVPYKSSTTSKSTYTPTRTTSSSGNVRTYTQPRSTTSRPTYNSSSSRSSSSSYTPSRSSNSSYTPSRSSGSVSRPTSPRR